MQILAIVVFGALLIVSSALAATRLTSKNSVSYRFAASGNESFAGMNCGGGSDNRARDRSAD